MGRWAGGSVGRWVGRPAGGSAGRWVGGSFGASVRRLVCGPWPVHALLCLCVSVNIVPSFSSPASPLFLAPPSLPSASVSSLGSFVLQKSGGEIGLPFFFFLWVGRSVGGRVGGRKRGPSINNLSRTIMNHFCIPLGESGVRRNKAKG